jgi:succinate dehydrogenase/fumarate reductase cytochrome b subunit
MGAGTRRLFRRPDSGHISLMFKIIGIILAIMPIVLFLRAIFMRSKKTSQAVSEFKKQLDFAVWVILFFIACAVVYEVGKLIYQFLS